MHVAVAHYNRVHRDLPIKLAVDRNVRYATDVQALVDATEHQRAARPWITPQDERKRGRCDSSLFAVEEEEIEVVDEVKGAGRGGGKGRGAGVLEGMRIKTTRAIIAPLHSTMANCQRRIAAGVPVSDGCVVLTKWSSEDCALADTHILLLVLKL